MNNEKEQFQAHGGEVLVQIIGPKKKSKEYCSYIRFESNTGRYLGSLSTKQAAKLRTWCNRVLKRADK